MNHEKRINCTCIIIYVRLWSAINGAWQFNDYTYTASPTGGGGGVAAQITSPTPGSTFTSSSVTFGWNSGTGVTQYWLYVGSSQNASDIFNANQGTNRSVTVSNIPTDSRTIYVRLWSAINGAWQFNDYTYHAAGGGGGATNLIQVLKVGQSTGRSSVPKTM